MLPRYPVYVISKGRHKRSLALTARLLESNGCPFHLVVEPQERADYAASFGEDRLLVLPFSNLGLGSIPARNWVWEHAKAEGYERHWILDDNIRAFYRRWKSRRIQCQPQVALVVAEDFVDRYENVAIAGLQYKMFVVDGQRYKPFVLNCHVYSCLLIRNDLPQRWRGRYNEDADLCLQVLSAGWCTVLLYAFLIDKIRTMAMRGGNTDQLYAGDGRLKMARSLERCWPGVVRVTRRFQRPQHAVFDSWKRFDTPLKRKNGAEINPSRNEYGLELKEVAPVKSERLRGLVEEHRKLLAKEKKHGRSR